MEMTGSVLLVPQLSFGIDILIGSLEHLPSPGWGLAVELVPEVGVLNATHKGGDSNLSRKSS